MNQQSRPERPERPERPAVPRESTSASTSSGRNATAPQPAAKQSIWTPRLIAWLVLLVVLLVFALQNLERVELRLLFWVIDVQLVWIVLAAALLGYILGWFRPHFRSRG
jgi:uncharacterized integral membrane protein